VRCRAFVLIGLLLLVSPASADTPATACPTVRYYLLLFGGQGNILRPRTAHTWATYVRAETRPDGTVHLEQFTISWLPATLIVRPCKIRSEPGVNLDLYQTLKFMSGSWQRIALWGPYEVCEEHYRSAANHRMKLDSGAITYRVFDFTCISPDVHHCIHAVTRADPAFQQMAPPILWFGSISTAVTASALVRSGLVINPLLTHDWLLPALGLDEQKFIRRRHVDWLPLIRYGPRQS
jgi:hypothetical protein